jgi:hypothetical protein
MYELLAQDLKTGQAAATKRMVDLIDLIGDAKNGSIDWKTGKSTITNGDAMVKNIRGVIGDGGAGDPASNLLALLNDGFAVPNGAPAQGDPTFRFIPWRSLYDPIFLQSMTQQDWDWLGIAADTGPKQVPQLLTSKFAYYPNYVLDDAHAQSLSASAQTFLPALKKTSGVSTAPLTLLPVTAVTVSPLHPIVGVVPTGTATTTPIPTTTPSTKGDTGTSTLALGAAPSAPAPNPINADVLTLITDMVSCFKNAKVSLDQPIFVPDGIRICLDATCAQKLLADLQKVMVAAGGNVFTIVGAIASEGFAALGSLGALQWVGLAILHFVGFWWIMIQANITPRGVCIVHFFPWISALSGGLINGYAQGL